MTNKLKTRTKQFAMGAVVATLAVSGYAAFTDIVFPTPDFTSGTTISASQMNAKLNLLRDSINEFKFAFKTAQFTNYHGSGPTGVLTATPKEVVVIDFICPADGFVVATSSTWLFTPSSSTVIVDAVLQLTTTTVASPTPVFTQNGPGYGRVFLNPSTTSSEQVVSLVRRFSCLDGQLVRYGVFGTTLGGAQAIKSDLVLQFSPL